MLKSQNYPAQNTKCKDNERKAKDKEKDIPVQCSGMIPHPHLRYIETSPICPHISVVLGYYV